MVGAENVYVKDSPNTFRCGFPLNSTDILRPKEIKRRKLRLRSFPHRGKPNRLAPHKVYLRKLWRTISPCVLSSSPKP